MLKNFLKQIVRPVVKETIEESIEELKSKLESNANNLTQEKEEKQAKQIIAEVMMSAGPRKLQDSGLGEDACGLLLRSDLCFFWISDGTSESAMLEDKSRRINFSSRTLAQELGESFRRQVLSSTQLEEKVNDQEKIVDKLLRASLDGVMQKWSEVLNRIQSEDRAYLDSAFNDATNDFKDFSSTFLCGVMTTSGHLQVGCYGDSPFVVTSGNETELFRPENYRFFMRLNRDGDKYFFSTSNDFALEAYCFENVSLVAAGSDGIGRLPELVKALMKNFSFRDIRSKFAMYDPNTKDDKVLCILSLENF